MQSLRTPSLLLLATALAVSACDEFPEPLDQGGALSVAIEPVDWPSEVALEEEVTLSARVVDQQGRTIPSATVQWELLTDVSQGSAAGSAPELTATGLGWVFVQMNIADARFSANARIDSFQVKVAGVQLLTPTGDVSLDALDQTVNLTAAGLGANGTQLPGTGLEWTLLSGSGVTPSASAGDQITLTATAEGQAEIEVSHPVCVTGGACADTVRVTVDQVVANIDVPVDADTLVAQDTVELNGTGYDSNGNPAPNDPLTWTSSSSAVATVTSDGRVVAQGPGDALIIASDPSSGAADTARVNVQPSGIMEVQLTDAPADLLASARLYLSGAYVLDQVVTNGRRYLFEGPFSVDLLTLTASTTALGTRRVPATTYNNVFLVVDSAVLTLEAGYQFDDASTTRTVVPPVDTVAAAIHGGATFSDDETIQVVVDFDVDGSFPLPEPDGAGVVASAGFDPDVRALKAGDAASIAGSLTTAGSVQLADLTLRAIRTSPTVDTMYARTGTAGDFTFRYLTEGSYDLTMPAPPACHVASPRPLSVGVLAGQTVTGADLSVDSVTVDSLVITPGAATINAIGFTADLGTTAYEGTTPLAGFSSSWSSLNEGVATVSTAGVVTGQTVGSADIVATSCGHADTITVTVQQVPATVTVAPAIAELPAGDSVQYAAELLDSADVVIPGAVFEWSSSDTTIASVDLATGWARGKRSGQVQIQALEYASGLTATAEFNVLLATAESFALNYNGGCALTSTNEVSCWGVNPHGQLGFPPTNWRDPYGPQAIPLPTTETYTQVAMGGGHACALTQGGDIYCWGMGGSGELGNGGNTDSYVPVLVTRPGGETFTDVAAGNQATCAATASGQAYCWGGNWVGQLGNGTTSNTNVPTPVNQAGSIAIFDVTMEDLTACAVGTAGLAVCWGEGHLGQIGDGATSDRYSPAAVSMPAVGSFQEIVMSDDAACALGTNGIPYCWGANNGGIIDPTVGADPFTTPRQVGTETFQALGMSNIALCGATSTGAVRCTGGNYFGQFGNGTRERNPSLRFENGATGVTASMLDGGAWDTLCGLDVGGDVYCWGRKDMGILGTGEASLTDGVEYVDLPAGVDVESAADHVCALVDTNQVYCWGEWVGEFTNSTPATSTVPALAIAPPAGVVFNELATGDDHLCARTTGSQIYCLGLNYVGQLGNGTYNGSTSAWVLVPHPTGGAWTAISAGYYHTCAIDNAATMYCWGYNEDGQLGLGAGGGDTSYPAPTPVAGSLAFQTVSAKGWHTCATTTGSAAYCWGWNGYGHLGTGDFTNYNAPQPVSGGYFFNRISSGARHTCALSVSGQAFCWGRADENQIGDGIASGAVTTPSQVAGGFSYQAIHANENNASCGVEFDGTLKCWGNNYDDQMATGEQTTYPTPVDAWAGYSLMDISGFRGWENSICGIDSFGDIYCAGHHYFGATAQGKAAFSLSPVRVGGSGGS